MHPVIQNLLSRRNKRVPIDDGRKIALVLFGGLMTCVRGAGAMIALEDLGLVHAFDKIFSVSAGFANASWPLGGESRLGTSIYYEDLSGRRFINMWKPWKIADINLAMYVAERKKSPCTEKIWQARTKLYTRLYNVDEKRIEYLEIHSFDPGKYFDILKASILMRYFVPGAVGIGQYHYMDGGLTSRDRKEHMEYAYDSDATDILFVYNRPNQRKKKFPPSERIFEIMPPSGSRLGILETRAEVLKQSCIEMGTVVKKTFGEEGTIDLAYDFRN